MGLRSSKHSAAGPSSSSSPAPSCGAFVRRSRSVKSRVLNSSCLRSDSHSSDPEDAKVSDSSCQENSKTLECPRKTKSSYCQKSSVTNCTNSFVSGDGSTSREFSSCSLNPPNGFLSRLSFYPGNLSIRMSQARNLTSSDRSFSASSRGFGVSNEKDDFIVPSDNVVNRNAASRGCDFMPPCFPSRSLRRQDDNSASDSSPSFSEDEDHRSHVHNVLGIRSNTRVEFSLNSMPQFSRNQSDGAGIRHCERRVPTREPAERNVRFSRTLSVGRLRDRVLRRATLSGSEFSHFEPATDMRLNRWVSARRGLGLEEENAATDGHVLNQQVCTDNPSSSSHPIYGGGNTTQETIRTRARETRYADLLEHRSHFLERRRRIRSQVRALQRHGSRFGSLSGHERSCILSGRHRGGQCDCRITPQEASANDDGNATASISRIVMLAEALFEVLDEIHQQSVVLSSRPTASSIGSIPAPNEVVDSLPVKAFCKLKKKSTEDTAQCYICLVEYEEGDTMRILPCHHEFHKTCVDKWLKEIHRVCPLCRGDICRQEPSAT